MRYVKIGIITNSIDEGHPSYTVYLYNLIKNFKSQDCENEYYLIHHTNIDLDIYKENNEIIIPLPSRGIMKLFYWKHFLLPKELKKQKLDLLHDPRGIELLSQKFPYRKIITAQDISSLICPGMSFRGYISWKLFAKRAMNNSEKIIAISECLKQDIIQNIGIPEHKIKVVYNGKSEKFKPLSREKILAFRNKYKLAFPFVLYLGQLQPRKNILLIIRAFHKLQQCNDIKQNLVIAGTGKQYHEIFELSKQLGLENRIIFTGFIQDEDLPSLYNAADLFVFPSIYEAFGLPPLEAMACGVPVITSDRGAFPEVVGDAGMMVNPEDVDELATAMLKVLTNEGGIKDLMIRKGLERSKLFDWKTSAKQIIEIYNNINTEN